MNHRILLSLALLVGIIIGGVVFRPLPVANAQTKPPAAKPPMAQPPVIADPTLKPVPNDPTVKRAEVEVAKPVAKWEYKTIYNIDTKALNAEAAVGYELVSVFGGVNGSGENYVAVFKRPAK